MGHSGGRIGSGPGLRPTGCFRNNPVALQPSEARGRSLHGLRLCPWQDTPLADGCAPQGTPGTRCVRRVACPRRGADLGAGLRVDPLPRPRPAAPQNTSRKWAPRPQQGRETPSGTVATGRVTWEPAVPAGEPSGGSGATGRAADQTDRAGCKQSRGPAGRCWPGRSALRSAYRRRQHWRRRPGGRVRGGGRCRPPSSLCPHSLHGGQCFRARKQQQQHRNPRPFGARIKSNPL